MHPPRALRPLLFVLFGAVAMAGPALPQEAANLGPEAIGARVPLGRVVRLAGRAETGRGPLSPDALVYLDDAIETAGAGSWMELKLDRGGRLWIGSKARLLLGPAAEVPACSRTRDVVATLVLSAGHVRVAHDERDPATGPGRVEVRTPNAILCLLGSTIDVKARRRTAAHESSTFVYVSAGGVEISCPAGTRRRWPTVRLAAGTLLAFDDRGPAQPIRLSLDVPLSFFALAQATLGVLEDSPLQDRLDPRGVPIR